MMGNSSWSTLEDGAVQEALVQVDVWKQESKDKNKIHPNVFQTWRIIVVFCCCLVFLISKSIYLKKTVIIVDVYLISLYYITVFIPTWMPVVDHFNMKTWFYSLTQYKQCGICLILCVSWKKIIRCSLTQELTVMTGR